MTKDEIAELAVEAGWPLFAIQMLAGTEDEKRLQRFAALVAKAERDACEKVCDDLWQDDKTAYACCQAIRARGNA